MPTFNRPKNIRKKKAVSDDEGEGADTASAAMDVDQETSSAVVKPVSRWVSCWSMMLQMNPPLPCIHVAVVADRLTLGSGPVAPSRR